MVEEFKNSLDLMTVITGRTVYMSNILDCIKVYDLFPIPRNKPLNVNEVKWEFDSIITHSGEGMPGYIAYLCCPEGENYKEWCTARGIKPCTAQQKYNIRTKHRAFQRDHWKQFRFYELKHDTVLGTIPMSDKEKEMFSEYAENYKELTVSEFADEIKIAKLTQRITKSNEKLNPYFGDLELSNHQLLIQAIWGGVGEEQARNILYYDVAAKFIADKCLESLDDERRKTLIKMWVYEKRKFSEMGLQIDRSRDRVRQIVAHGLRQLRTPRRSSDLSDLLNIPRDPMIKRCIIEWVNNPESNAAKVIDAISRTHHINLIATNKVVQAIIVLSPEVAFRQLREKDVDLLSTNKKENGLLKMKIEDIGLSVRAYNAFWRASIRTVEDILECARIRGLASIRNLGKHTYYDVINKLEELGVADMLPRDPANGDNPGEDTVNW